VILRFDSFSFPELLIRRLDPFPVSPSPAFPFSFRIDAMSDLEWRRLLVPLVIVLLGRRARFLSPSGAVAAMLVGSTIVLRGWDVAAMIILFFALGSVATKVKQKEKEAAMPYPETEAEASLRAAVAATVASSSGTTAATASPKAKHQGRDMWQVLATGLVPALICALQPLFPEEPSASSSSSDSGSFLSTPPTRPLWFLTYLAFVATCCGDTLASEIGMLSRQKPLMLWHRQRVPRGVDGGMTLLGTAASVVGGAVIGACAGNMFDVYCGAIYGQLCAYYHPCKLSFAAKRKTTLCAHFLPSARNFLVLFRLHWLPVRFAAGHFPAKPTVRICRCLCFLCRVADDEET
jgi:uncharacterized membrane protein